MKIKILTILMLLLALTSVNSASKLFECNWRDGSCQADESPFFYANQHFTDGSGNVLSSNVAIVSDSNYNQALCCKINEGENGDLGSISISNKPIEDACDTAQNSGTDELMYFTGSDNARVGFDLEENDNFNKTYFSHKMCLTYPDTFSHLNIVVSEKKSFSNTGYECLYRTSNITNGVVSSCDATYDSGKKYKYTVWAKLWENVESLKCNTDCTSRLDSRVYQSCSLKISECSAVPAACDGSLLGAWVEYDEDSDGINDGEVQCSAPWNTRELQVVSTEVKVSSDDETCANVIKKEVPVILNNEPVVMGIYICNE